MEGVHQSSILARTFADEHGRPHRHVVEPGLGEDPNVSAFHGIVENNFHLYEGQ